MFLQVSQWIVTRREIVPDIQVEPELFRERHSRFELVRPRRVIVQGDHDVILFGKRLQSKENAQRGRCRDNARPQSLRHLKALINFLIRKAVVEAQIVGVKLDTAISELLPDLAILIESDAKTPFTKDLSSGRV